MKKLFQLFLIPLFIGLLLGGCGGVGGDADGDGDPALHSVTLKEKSLALDETRQEGNLTLEVTTTQAEDLKLELTDFRLLSDKYEITVLEVTPSTLVSDVSGRYEVTIRFRYKASASTRALTSSDFGFKVSYRKVMISKISHSSVSETVVVSVESAPSVTLPGEGEEEGSSENAYIEISYFMASSTVSEPGESLEIVIQANDKNSTPLKPAAGVAIDILPLAPADGSMDALRKTTDANGRVTFSYSAPSVITPGREVNLTIYVENHPDVTVQIPITFTATQSGVQTGDLEISLPDSQLLITEGGVSRTIVAQLSDKTTRQPVEGMDIVVSTFDLTHGMLDKYRATTDENGRVFFNYTAPDDITALYGGEFAIEMKLEANASVAQTLQVRFERPDEGDTASYRIDTPAESVTITEAGESRRIDAYLVDTSTNRPVSDRDIVVDFFESANGTLDRYRATTDENGHVVFNYTAPADLTALDGQRFTITMRLDGNASVVKPVEMVFAQVQESRKFGFTADENLTVTKSDETYTVQVALSYVDENNLSHAAAGEKVFVEFIQPLFGRFDTYTVTTDSSGIATFTYHSPNRILDLNGTILTFHWAKDINVSKTMDLVFDPQTDEKAVSLYLIPTEMEITDLTTPKTLKLVVVNNRNVGVATSIELEQPTNSDDIDYGRFDKTILETDESGVAEVTYTPPSAWPEGNLTRLLKVTELSQNIQKTLTLSFVKTNETNGTSYQIAVETPARLQVDGTGELTVTIHEFGYPDTLIDSAHVKKVRVTSRFLNKLEVNGTNPYEYSGYATWKVPLEAKTVSGVALVDINATVFNGTEEVNLSRTVEVVVFSGPVSALSLVYVGSEYDTTSGLFHDTWTIHAVDKYANPAQKGVDLHPSLINGWKFATDISAGGRKGELKVGDPAQFVDTSNAPFTAQNVEDQDRIIVLPYADRLQKAYLGNWSIDAVVDSTTVDLKEKAVGSNVDRLRYVLGNEKRTIRGQLALAHVTSSVEDGNFTTDENGIVQFDVIYDPLLVGHTFSLSAVAYEDVNRSGTAVRTLFKGTGYNTTTAKVPNDGNASTVSLTLTIKPTSDYLVGITVTPDSIVSDSTQCYLDPNAPETNLTTDDNGRIAARIKTLGTDTGVKECVISWKTGNSSIYYEY